MQKTLRNGLTISMKARHRLWIARHARRHASVSLEATPTKTHSATLVCCRLFSTAPCPPAGSAAPTIRRRGCQRRKAKSVAVAAPTAVLVPLLLKLLLMLLMLLLASPVLELPKPIGPDGKSYSIHQASKLQKSDFKVGSVHSKRRGKVRAIALESEDLATIGALYMRLAETFNFQDSETLSPEGAADPTPARSS